MTPTDLETLRGLVKEASAFQKQLDDGDGAYPSDYHDMVAKLSDAIPALTALLAERDALREPIDCLLFCPKCKVQHVDAPEPENEWTNPPHRKHLCHNCGNLWYASDRPTKGVQSILNATLSEGDKHD